MTQVRLRWQGMGCTRWFVVVLTIGTSGTVAADPGSDNADFFDRFVQQVVKDTRFSGKIGLYDFRRYHNANQPYPGNPTQDPDANYNLYGTAIGGGLKAETGMLYGVSAGLGVRLSQSLIDYDNPNPNLLGENGDHLRAITQGYLQYNYPGLRLRGGRQLLKTPFATGDQFAFLPIAFNGVSMAIHPLMLYQQVAGDGDDAGAAQAVSGSERFVPPSYDNDLTMDFSFGARPQTAPAWSLYLARMYRFELRTRDEFQTGNRYVNNTSGFLTAGTQFSDSTNHGDVIARYWHYNFYDTLRQEFVEAGYQTPTLLPQLFGGVEPFLRVQYSHGYDSGSRRIGSIDADVFAGKLGFQFAKVSLSVVGHYSPSHRGAFRGGTLAHPYTDLTGLFYTDTINNGVGDLGPGHAIGGQIQISPSDNIQIFTHYVTYAADSGQSHDFYDYSGPQGYAANTPIVNNQHSWEWDAGIQFDFGAINKKLAGLTFDNGLGITHVDGSPRFYDNRLRLSYQF